MNNNRTFSTHDASFSVISHSDDMKEGDVTLYREMLSVLREAGFKVNKDPDIERDYPTLTKTHDAGSHGELKFKSEYYPVGFKFEFYQDIVFENSSGGYYDFDKRLKMPYLIRKRFELAVIKLKARCTVQGFTERLNKHEVNAAKDPLLAFNIRWDMGGMSRGTLRFERCENGWPADKVINSWSRKDANGIVIDHGDEKYLRNRAGYLLRGRVYGGINGMWMFVYGKDSSDVTHASASEFFSCNPSEVPRKVSPYRKSKLQIIKNEAVKSENYEKAAAIRDLIAAEFGAAA